MHQLDPKKEVSTTQEKALVVLNLTKEYGHKRVLDNVNFTAYRKTIHGLIGANGSGKTTLMTIAVGLSIASAGDVFIDGASVTKGDFLNVDVAYVAAETAILLDWEVQEYIVKTNLLKGLKEKDIMEVFKATPLYKFRFHYLKELSSGWRKIVHIFAATIFPAKIIVLDEPFLFLDPKMRFFLIRRLKKIKEEGRTILISTHILSDLQVLADDITIISDGKILYTGKKTENIEDTYSRYFFKNTNEKGGSKRGESDENDNPFELF